MEKVKAEATIMGKEAIWIHGRHIFTLKPGQILYLYLDYKKANPLAFKDGHFLYNGRFEEKAEEIAFILRIPKTDTSLLALQDFRKIEFILLHPTPERIEDDGKYKVLIWTKPGQILENGKKQFQPIVEFHYITDWPLILFVTVISLIAGVTAGVLGSVAYDGLKRLRKHLVLKV